MVACPIEVLDQLRREARDGTLPEVCQSMGIEMLVAFGSVVDPTWPEPPRDLDLAVLLADGHNILEALDALVVQTGYEKIDLMDLSRAGAVARAQALGRGELLYEAVPGTFAECQVAALVQYLDTQWMRDLELQDLAR